MSNAFEAKAAQLVAAFEQRLNQDKRELITNANIARGDFVDTGLEPLRFIAHRIVGSARLFNCEQLSLPAKKVEDLVEQGADISLVIEAVNNLIDQIDGTLTDGVPMPDWIKSQDT